MFDDRQGPRVRQNRQPVGDGVHVGPLGKLVRRGLDREDVQRRPEPAQRRRSHLGSRIRWWTIRFAGNHRAARHCGFRPRGLPTRKREEGGGGSGKG